jgi:hypothetical protein
MDLVEKLNNLTRCQENSKKKSLVVAKDKYIVIENFQQ